MYNNIARKRESIMKLKKIFVGLLSLLTIISLGGCVKKDDEEISLITPTGTPSLILGKSITERGNVKYDIVQGPDALKAAFIKGEKDIIVAPVNLGALMKASNESFSYRMVYTIVWCNYYIASNDLITSFSELDGKDVVVFGQNSTPDIIFRSLVSYYDIAPTVTYVSSVAEANGMLLSNKAHTIVTAEPALSVLLSKGTYNVLPLKDEWGKMVGDNEIDVPQAAIFVNIEAEDKCKSFLDRIKNDIENVKTNKDTIVREAKSIDSNLTSQDSIYIDALERCNYKICDNQKQSIELYFNKVIELGLGKTVGGKLPDETFYYSK